MIDKKCENCDYNNNGCAMNENLEKICKENNNETFKASEKVIRQDERNKIFNKIKSELWQEDGDNDYISVRALLELIESEVRKIDFRQVEKSE